MTLFRQTAGYVLILTSGFLYLSTVCYGCTERAVYRVTYATKWTKPDHPKDFPSSAHFSGLVGGSHNTNYKMWSPGDYATRGIEVMAELGKQIVLMMEMVKQDDNVLDFLAFGGVGNGTGMRQGTLDVDSDHRLVSLVSMLAPSPDWFIGVHDIDMCDSTSNQWMNSTSRELFPYDAGTDSGLKFTSPDNDTQPRQPISLLTNTDPDDVMSSFYGSDPVKPFATLSFELTSGALPVSAAINFIGAMLLFLYMLLY